MGKGSSGSRKDSGNGPRDQEQYRNEQRNNQRGKYYYPKYIQEKLAITVLVITLALFALVMILYRIIKDNNEQYNKIVLSQRQQEYDSRVIPYRRGDIVDRNGTYLATSEKVYNLILDPSQIMDKPDYYLEPTIQALVDVFGFDGNELRGLIQERPKRAYLRYKNGRQLSYDQKTEFEQTEKERNAAYRKSDDDNQSRFRVTGVWFEDEYRRIYPYGSTACNVIGFASGDGSNGTGGIEQYYNDSLIGVNGREYGYLDEDANLEGVVKSAVNGRTVVSTIDVNVQNILQKYIDEWQTSVGSHVTAAIAMNPNNGEILGMATSNKFDLNDPRKIEGYSDDQLYELGKKDAVSVYKREHPDTTLTQEQMIADIYTNLSHDIRTPLTSLDGYFQLLEEAKEESDRKRYIGIIQERIGSLKEMLEELFTYTKLQNGTYELKLERQNMSQILKETVFSYYDNWMEQGIRPQFEITEEPVWIQGNRQALRRTMQNIIKNGLDHGNKEINIQLTKNGNEAELVFRNKVTDPGEIDIKRVFERFYKADRARSKNSTGLGLSISRGFVWKMNGEITAEIEGNWFCIKIRFACEQFEGIH